MVEHMEPGSVDEINFFALPFREGDGVLHGEAAGDFFFVIGGYGRTVGDTALGRGHFGGMQQSGDEGGFAALCMPHYSYVADLTSLVSFHDASPCGWNCYRSPIRFLNRTGEQRSGIGIAASGRIAS